MDTLLKGLGTYDLLLNLIPGLIFIGLAPNDLFDIVATDNMILLGAVAFFIGCMINRIGSVGVELVMQKAKLVQYVNYEKYLRAERIEHNAGQVELQALVRKNILYRTLAALCFCLSIMRYYSANVWYTVSFISLSGLRWHFQVLILDNLFYWIFMILFLKAFIKQTDYIRARVNYILEKRPEA